MPNNKVKHLKDYAFFADNWDTFTGVLPPECHIVEKITTHAVERDKQQHTTSFSQANAHTKAAPI